MPCLLFLLFWFNAFSFYDFLSIEYTKRTTDAEINLQEAHNDSGALKRALPDNGHFIHSNGKTYDVTREPVSNENTPEKNIWTAVGVFIVLVLLRVLLFATNKLKCVECCCCDDSSSYGTRRTITPPGSPTTIPPNNPFQHSYFQTREAGRTDSIPIRPSAPPANAEHSNVSDSPPSYYAAVLVSKPAINKDKIWSTFEEPPNYASVNPT